MHAPGRRCWGPVARLIEESFKAVGLCTKECASAPGAPQVTAAGLQIDGKQFELDGARFPFRGVTYGTFAARGDGEPYPERPRAKFDFTGIADAGFTVGAPLHAASG